ncbi:hypothetical protein JZ751_014429 [Albula glossodonta]|uniref:Uncharacterized protein n=1 Tax=Albula glossodonta TaxID=121402 RepID=A0A8T2MX22_9TELE|nr:hypothetical protein JZ751_014429 [Albula glossodonta]
MGCLVFFRFRSPLPGLDGHNFERDHFHVQKNKPSEGRDNNNISHSLTQFALWRMRAPALALAEERAGKDTFVVIAHCWQGSLLRSMFHLDR